MIWSSRNSGETVNCFDNKSMLKVFYFMGILSLLAGDVYNVDKILSKMCIAAGIIFAIFVIAVIIIKSQRIRGWLLICCGITLSIVIIFFIKFSLDPDFWNRSYHFPLLYLQLSIYGILPFIIGIIILVHYYLKTREKTNSTTASVTK